MIETPQSFIVREECLKAASQNGFRRVLGEEAGWAVFGSTTAQGEIHLAAAGTQGPWFLALEHAGVIAELGLPAAEVPGPGCFRLAFDSLGALYPTLRRVYALGSDHRERRLRRWRAALAAPAIGRPRRQEYGDDPWHRTPPPRNRRSRPLGIGSIPTASAPGLRPAPAEAPTAAQSRAIV
jgi:hypothetical protein